MLSKSFTVYDEKTSAYMTPFFDQSLGSALRNFTDTCLNTEHPFNKHPEDYTLFHLGEFNDQDGNYQNLETPISLATALEIISTNSN